MYSTYIPRPTFIRRNNKNKLHTEKGNSQGIYNPNDTLQDYIIVGLAMFSVPMLIIILGYLSQKKQMTKNENLHIRKNIRH